jgi:UDP-N-acetylglucosamine 2-epimerase (non-hydrolysing)
MRPLLVHTGQHYDSRMSGLFFDELRIPEPDINLGVGSGTHTQQTAEIMKRFEPVVEDFGPDFVLVVGDVNSTVACGLVAVKLGTRLIHVEAGLRSFDRAMPEEVNRVITDSISDLLFVTEESGLKNLKNEGVPDHKVHFVGNVMIDTLLAQRDRAGASGILDSLGLQKAGYGAVTLHRPCNVDDSCRLEEILCAFEEIDRDIPLVFPVHPRTRNRLASSGLLDRFQQMKNFRLVEPLGYLDFLHLMSESAFVMTDSGGIQEETTILRKPCITLRNSTERPVTITHGTNTLVGCKRDDILTRFRTLKENGYRVKSGIPEKWDGKAAQRIVSIIDAY